MTIDPALTQAALARNEALALRDKARQLDLDARYLVQMAHLTTPATVW